jgi:hypothetical protein
MRRSVGRSPYDNRPLILRQHLMRYLIRLLIAGAFLLLLTAGVSNGSGLAVALVAGGIVVAAAFIGIRYQWAIARLAPSASSKTTSSAGVGRARHPWSISTWRALIGRGRIGNSDYLGGNEYFNEDAPT